MAPYLRRGGGWPEKGRFHGRHMCMTPNGSQQVEPGNSDDSDGDCDEIDEVEHGKEDDDSSDDDDTLAYVKPNGEEVHITPLTTKKPKLTPYENKVKNGRRKKVSPDDLLMNATSVINSVKNTLEKPLPKAPKEKTIRRRFG